ncbi:cadherin domain-containing protein, partial [Bradyrhizobium sp. JYMT SZCCT0428]|uniref:cadherin domain-containing protein n=1 Tax=Bradyrhizobium sp. JYMT SZCCT0428 TaxID=2807673 RepID=UPI001BACD685
DTTAPTPTFLTLPGTVNVSGAGQAATFTLGALDDLSGVSQAAIFFDRQISYVTNGVTSTTSGFGFDVFQDSFSDGQSSWTQTLSPYSGTGTYNVTQLNMVDNAGNSRWYSGAELAALGLTTSFTVAGGSADTTAPTPTFLTLPGTVNVSGAGQAATFTLGALDDLSGVSQAAIFFDRQISYVTNGVTSTTSGFGFDVFQDSFSDGQSSWTQTLSSYSGTGTYNVTQLNMVDNAGNSRWYSGAELAALGLTTSFTVTTTENSAPIVTSNGGGNTAPIFIAENTTAVTTVAAADPDGQTLSYSIIGGADASKFTISSTTGALSFITAPNFEARTDAAGNNIYDVIVQVSDGSGGIDTQAIAVTVTDVFENTVPIIITNGGGATSAISIVENTTTVTTVTATDPDFGQTLSYSIIGGVDASKFTIGSTTGALSFLTVTNFELPNDVGGNNIYNVTVQVSDGHGGTDTQAVAVTVTDVFENRAPTVTSNGGGNTVAVFIAESNTTVTTVTATDPDVAQTLIYSINGGADASKFTIAPSTGVLSFVTAPNFELRTDTGGNNVYDVTVQVSDGNGGTDNQAVAVTVTDINEASVITSNGGGNTAAISIAENTTTVTTVTATDPDVDHWRRGRERIHHSRFDWGAIVRHRTEL